MRSDTGEARWEFKVKDLVTKLRSNRTLHVHEFKEAWTGYMKALEDKLSGALEEVKSGKDVDLYELRLDKPHSHEKDYSRVIEVLEMTSADTVKLTLNEFDKYVRDNWEWTESFKMSSSAYR
jgi:hypothetical protein